MLLDEFDYQLPESAIAQEPLDDRSSARLLVDVDASVPQSVPKEVMNFDECEVRAALADPSGGPIEGFSFDRSSRILESGEHEIRWEGADLSRLQDQPVRLRLEMRCACLYSIHFT